MAKIFRRPRQLHPIAELNVTNMVDLGFTLLIIFMITTTPELQQEQTIPVNLPGESRKPQAKPDPDTLYKAVSIDETGNFYYERRKVTFTELSAELAKLAALTKQPVIRIRADMNLQWQQVVRLMDEITKRNLTKITFDTESK
jgi:biopolymer transport protein ExbD